MLAGGPTAHVSQSRGTARVVITAVSEGFNRDPGALILAGGPTALRLPSSDFRPPFQSFPKLRMAPQSGHVH